ncbi:DNA primase/helicase [Rhizobium phage Pasto]|uniref:DNA helicase/primase n=1 Tax=Rhizobium phage Pasto TaxID=2767575 RepID=A0A7S6R7Y9_9CAUD|nr:DNA primase/helicase [Rhizobium phage Pasto]
MSHETESEFIDHEPCEKCGSSDGLARYDDGHGYCFVCQHYEPADGEPSDQPRQSAKKSKDLLPIGEFKPLPPRKLTEETCKKWGYTIGQMGNQPVQIANYKNDLGQIVAQKVRFKNKDFRFLGETKEAGLFGQHLWRDGGKRIVITEGELDAMSVSQVQGHKWPVVSLANGAQSAKKALQASFEWLDKFDEIVLMFDNDEAGREAVEKCGSIRFKAGKLKIAKLPLKDANEMLVAGRGSEIVDAIFGAKAYRPDGIVAGADMWDTVNQQDEEYTLELPFMNMQKMTLGVRLGELWTFTAGSGIGKSAIVREIAYNFVRNDETVGMIMLEENVKRTARGLMGLGINKPAHAVWNELTDEEKKEGFDLTLGTNRIFLYDHFGSSDIDNIVSKIRYMAVGCDAKVVILDHLSIIVSGTEDGDERRLIDNIMTELKTLAMELNIAIILVSHLKRPQGDKGHEDGARTSLAQLRGSHAIAQLSDFVVGAERDQQGEFKNITTLRLLKNRYTGETGECGWLEYDPDTGRLVECMEDPRQKEADGSDYDFGQEQTNF